MNHARGLTAVLTLLIGTTTLWGQFLPPFGGGVRVGGGFGFSFNKWGGNKSLSFQMNASYARFGGFGYSAFPAYGYGYPGFYGFGPPPINYVSIVAPPPPPPIIVVAPPPRLEPEGFVFVEVGRRPEGPMLPEIPMPGEPAGRFRPVVPAEREPMPPNPAPKPERPRQLPPPPAPEDDPEREYERLLALGRAAFAVQQRGRALHRFRQAVALNPGEPTGRALLAQTLFSLGKYTEAVETIQTLMRLDPDWENTPFRPLELYGPNPADWPENLRTLEAAVKASPEDSVLLFLLGHQLWLDGRQDEAVRYFERAARFAPEKDRPFLRRFLQARPAGGPVV